MGRAIQMEKDIDAIKSRLDRMDRVLSGVCSTLSELEDAVFETENEEEIEDGKKETNNEGNDTSSNKSNKRKADALSETSKS